MSGCTKIGLCALMMIIGSCSEPAEQHDLVGFERDAMRDGRAGAVAAVEWAKAARAAGEGLSELEAIQRLEQLGGQDATRCLAEVGLAELETDRVEGYRRAYRASRSGCTAEAEALLNTLAQHRPPAGELAAIDRELGLVAGRSCTLIRLAAFGAGTGGIRAVAYFDGECEAEGVQEGTRFVARVPGFRAADDVPANLDIDAGGLVRIGWVDDEEGGRIVAELGEGARAHAYSLSDRLIVDIATETPIAERAEGRAIVVVLDPGHGGREHGALFEELKESELVLDIALRVRRILQRRLPASRVIMTREQDEPVSLEQRTALANAAEADLFVSVHLNSADEPVAKGGITTFILDSTDDEQAVRLAARENGTTTRHVTGIQRLIARLHRREQVGQSRRLADRIHAQTLAGGRRVMADLSDRGVRSALFYVLVGARMPAVLLEASFLTKPEEARALRTEPYREALAGGIAEGIVQYAAEDTIEDEARDSIEE